MAQPDTKLWDGLNRGAGAFSTPGVDPHHTPPDYVPNPAAPQVTFGLKNVDPPSSLYVSQEDSLQVRAYYGNAGGQLLVIFRTLRPDGTVFETFQTLQLAAIQTLQTFQINLEEGYLLGLLVALQATGGFVKTAFAAVNLIRNASVQVLCSGGLVPGVFLGWPGGPMLLPRDGAGVVRSVTGSTPAAGAEISETVPVNTRWKLLSFRTQLVTAVAVANREPRLILDDGVNEYYRVDNGANIAASLTTVLVWAPSVPIAAGIATDQIAPIPGDTWLAAGHRIRTLTAGIQAADQYSAPQYLVLEWFDQQI